MTEDFKRRAKNLLLLDIETVCSQASYDELPERMQKLWDKKALTLKKGEDTTTNAAFFYDRGAIYAEFGKIICIAFGAYYWNEKDEIAFKVSSFAGNDEVQLLLQFKALIEKYPAEQLILCAHNGKEFDKSVLTFSAKPCIVTQRLAFTPSAQIFLGFFCSSKSIHTPVNPGMRPACTSYSANVRIIASSSVRMYTCMSVKKLSRSRIG